MQPSLNLDDPALYLNRDLSWLEFNRRVLEEAQDATVPMLERLKFLAIFSSNLDEFFMVRVGGIQQKVQANIPIGSGADQMPPRLQLEQVRETVCVVNINVGDELVALGVKAELQVPGAVRGLKASRRFEAVGRPVQQARRWFEQFFGDAVLGFFA